MNSVGSDLEEGEIIDSSPPPSPNFNNNKRRKLPQRYTIDDNKSIMHKHRKGCKHSVRHHAKKLSKLKKNPTKLKDIPKRHHKPTCIHEKSRKVSSRYDSSETFKNIFPKNWYFSQNSLIAEMKGSLKNVSSHNKLNTNLDKPKLKKIPFLKQNINISENNCATSISGAEMLKDNSDSSVASTVNRNSGSLCKRTSDSDLNEISDVTCLIEFTPITTPDLIDLTKSPDDSIIESNSNDTVKNVDNSASNNFLQVKEEESEDEEELRRIALATCAKRKAFRESESTIQNIDYPCNVPVPDLKYGNDVEICHQAAKNPTIKQSDNYEVVDMEVDEEMQDSLETVQISLINQKSESTENLFVIDTNPCNDFLQDKENSFSKPQTTCNSSDEEFEVDILRAELINSMYRKKLKQEDLKQKLNITSMPEKRMPVIQQKKHLVNYQTSNLTFRNKRLKSAKHFLRKRSVNKLGGIKNNKMSLPVQANKSSPRLIITVNEESSDDSDNTDEEASTVSENPVDSIVALISDCRQKSESSTETKEKEIVPQAVSCLSKAQQEEYNSLIKILAKKKKLPAAQGTLFPKNGLIRSPLDDLKKLEEKLIVLSDAMKNTNKSMTILSKEVNSNKFQYMKSKLTVQHLKERLIASEKDRKTNLLKWSKSCDDLKLLKKSASDLEKKFNEIQNLCFKLGSSLRGKSYKLPLLLHIEKS